MPIGQSKHSASMRRNASFARNTSFSRSFSVTDLKPAGSLASTASSEV